jgi:L-asparaginase
MGLRSLVALPLVLLLPAAASGPAAAQHAAAADTLPRVHVIATGGTIAATPDGSLSGAALIAALPGAEGIAHVSVEQLLNVGSSQITPADWLHLSVRIDSLYRADPQLAGIVVTHGTDTMEETAFFLHLTLGHGRPVVVTGAMRPARAVGADGPANLMNAIRVAADAGAGDRPVMILMNDELHAAPAAVKLHTTRTDAFASTWGGVLGVADVDGVTWHTPAARGPLQGSFPVAGDTRLPRVDIVYSYAGGDGSAIRAAAASGVNGLVVAAVGRGNLPAAQREALREFESRHGIAVLSSRTQSGRVPEVGGVIGAGELNPQKARVLLMLLLAASAAPHEVALAFGRM